MPPLRELGDIHGRITHEGKRDPMRDAERAAFCCIRTSCWEYGEVAVQVEEQVGTEVVVAVDEHGGLGQEFKLASQRLPRFQNEGSAEGSW